MGEAQILMDRPILSKKASFNSAYSGAHFGGQQISQRHSFMNVNVGQQPHYPTYSSSRAATKPSNVFRYDANYQLFAGDWSASNLIALGSFNEQPSNFITVVEAQQQQPLYKFTMCAEAPVKMPQTKIAWEPFGSSRIISGGDTLRMWQYQPNHLAEIATFIKRSKSQPNQESAPLTSFDWNVANINMVITASVDTTCTVWDLTSHSVTTQLIAHDKEVNDVGFLPGSQHKFVSAGADGSVRLFDLRSLDNSTIIYEGQNGTEAVSSMPILRATPSIIDQNIICAFAQDENYAVVLDIRATVNPVTKLEGHQAPINSIRWLPNTSNLIATGSDDCQILIWDISRGTVVGSYSESQQVNNILASKDGNLLGSIHGKSLQGISTQML